MLRIRSVQDDDGRAPERNWPQPAEGEGLWATPLGDGLYRLENVPWFDPNSAIYDVVTAVEFEGTRWVMQKAQWSGHLTIWVTRCDPAAVLATFAELGVTGESAAPAYDLAALDIPPDADFRAIRGMLRAGKAAGTWDFHEACVSAEWSNVDTSTAP
ncbi:DUF4265 domain-containing protein [Dactylosporangium vinaceum]|uniref:DUF4265 domain-containing protein n=1 Tax=Dactylosporangium vinaceum TaxID=53362 RepID=A0ABV5M9F7_9ACTN|nr:DUF4265 domain-containing protein [Dactylosporangium vinaceum]UAC00007.1 DUF4265 domain-containing protein [Dactylosporangium vinaceum]